MESLTPFATRSIDEALQTARDALAIATAELDALARLHSEGRTSGEKEPPDDIETAPAVPPVTEAENHADPDDEPIYVIDALPSFHDLKLKWERN